MARDTYTETDTQLLFSNKLIFFLFTMFLVYWMQSHFSEDILVNLKIR